MQFLKFSLKRIGLSAMVLLAVIVFNFFLIHLAPGDVVDTIVGEMGGASEESTQAMRISYGLDKSLPQQLFQYVKKMFQGDLGISHYSNTPVVDLILHRIPATILLVLSAILLAAIVGTFFGVLASRKPNGIVSHLVTVLSLFGYSAPVFWTGILLLILFSWIFPIFPPSGMYDIMLESGAFVKMIDVLHHLFLPMITLASLHIALYARLSRSSMLDVLGSDYIRTARAKGLPERIVLFKHALKNAILPIVTMTGLQISQILAGAVVVEKVFNWPGLGTLAFESIVRRDTQTLLGILFFSAVLVIIANFITDITYSLIDPRITSGEKQHG
jgi:peptide/nickel transport system permease protein